MQSSNRDTTQFSCVSSVDITTPSTHTACVYYEVHTSVVSDKSTIESTKEKPPMSVFVETKAKRVYLTSKKTLVIFFMVLI